MRARERASERERERDKGGGRERKGERARGGERVCVQQSGELSMGVPVRRLSESRGVEGSVAAGPP